MARHQAAPQAQPAQNLTTHDPPNRLPTRLPACVQSALREAVGMLNNSQTVSDALNGITAPTGTNSARGQGNAGLSVVAAAALAAAAALLL